MSANSKIEWTDATWNPTVGCSIVSPGCTNCYAMQVAHSLERRFNSSKYRGLTKVVNGHPVWTGEVRLDEEALLQPLRWKKPKRIFVNSMSDLFHESLPDTAIDKVLAVAALCQQHIFQILTKRPERMRDYCADPQTPFRIARAVDALRGAPSSDQKEEIRPLTDWPGYYISDHGRVLTDHGSATCVHCGGPIDDKSALARVLQQTHTQVRNIIAGRQWCIKPVIEWPLANVWAGVSCERQQEADERIPLLLQTPAAVRFVSLEPLLGPIDLTRISVGECETAPGELIYRNALAAGQNRIDWVICGGEFGRDARPMHPRWAQDIRDQCSAAGVAFFFKQFGEFAPEGLAAQRWIVRPDGSHASMATSEGIGHHSPQGGASFVYRVGKKAAGRLLDGREWNEFPEVAKT